MSRSPASRSNRTTTAARTPGGGRSLSFLVVSPMMLFGLFLRLVVPSFMDYSALTKNNGDTVSVAAAGGELAVPANNAIAPLFTPEVRYWADDIVRWADQHGLDPNLAATVMQIESCGNTEALSRAGAQGLFQVMPYHFAPGEAAFTPEVNANRGLGYLAAMQAQFGTARLTLAAYNGGPGNAAQAEWAWPDETQRYVYWGEHIYQDAQRGAAHSDVLDEWLSAGGVSLCAQAHDHLMLALQSSP